MRAMFIIAANTFRDVLRQKVIWLMILAALVLTLSSKYLLKMNIGQEQLVFISDFTTGALGFFGTIIAITSICQMLYSEFENRTATTLLSKPVSAADFVFGKLFGEVYLLGVFVVMLCVSGGIMMFYVQSQILEMPEEMLIGRLTHINFAGFAAYGIVQFLKLLTIAAMSLFICIVSRSLMFAIIVSFMACMVSLMMASEFSEGGGLAQQIAGAFFPNFKIFEASESFIFNDFETLKFLAILGYSLIYILMFGLLGSYLFSKREV